MNDKSPGKEDKLHYKNQSLSEKCMISIGNISGNPVEDMSNYNSSLYTYEIVERTIQIVEQHQNRNTHFEEGN